MTQLVLHESVQFDSWMSLQGKRRKIQLTGGALAKQNCDLHVLTNHIIFIPMGGNKGLVQGENKWRETYHTSPFPEVIFFFVMCQIVVEFQAICSIHPLPEPWEKASNIIKKIIKQFFNSRHLLELNFISDENDFWSLD